MNSIEKIRESNRIERILREPTDAEVAEYNRFLALRTITLGDLERFVSVYAPGHVLRDKNGINVRIGRRVLAGGPHVRTDLERLLGHVNAARVDPFEAHVLYEMLHPFGDGNGRSGRMLWYWQMEAIGYSTALGFLHTFYYQTLQYRESHTDTAVPDDVTADTKDAS